MPHPTRPLPFVLLLLPVLLSAETPRFTIASRAEPERPYRLFVGIDLRVLHHREFVVVADFEHEQARLADPERTEVAVGQIGAIRFDHTTKIGALALTISDIKTERTYSGGNPRWEWMMAQSGVQGQVQDKLASMERDITRAGSLPTSGAITTPDGNTVVTTNPMADAINAYTSFATQSSKISDSSYYAEQAREEDAEAAFDAMVIEATLSAAAPIANAYAIGIARIRTDEAGFSDVVFFNEIGDLGPAARVVKMRKDGLPPGFEVVDIDLHLYREGQELVSNRRSKQFALTREEALEFLSLDRLARHKGETIPAEPAWSMAPAELFAANDPKDFDVSFTVQVDEKGQIVDVVAPAGTAPGSVSLLEQLPFLPALRDGQPVSGTVAVNLKDFFR